ncbi:hypothetical protein FOZ63_023530, partial [Perkinsus olseni]
LFDQAMEQTPQARRAELYAMRLCYIVDDTIRMLSHWKSAELSYVFSLLHMTRLLASFFLPCFACHWTPPYDDASNESTVSAVAVTGRLRMKTDWPVGLPWLVTPASALPLGSNHTDLGSTVTLLAEEASLNR